MLTEKDMVAACSSTEERRQLIREAIDQWGLPAVLALVEYNTAAKANGYAYKAEDEAERLNLRMYERSYSSASSFIAVALDHVRNILGA